MISAALELAGWLGPKVVGALSGSEKAEDTAEKVVDTAKAVTGQDDEQAAVEAIKKDPKQARQFKEKMAQIELELEREETKRLSQINKTMRAEYEAKGWKSGWRPFFGYIFTLSYGILFLGAIALIFYAATESIAQAVKLMGSLGDMVAAFTPLLGIGLAVLGVQMRQRSKDKELASGQAPKGIVEQISGIFGGGKKKGG